MDNFLISVVVPVFNEEEGLLSSVKIIENTVDNINYEIILIDDGSSDGTWGVIEELSSKNPRIRGLALSRNFGKESAICAGIEHVSGQACIIMDSDLQHPPELIPKMINIWMNTGVNIVEAVKSKRGKESLINKIGSKIFYNILNSISEINLNDETDFKLIDQKVIQAWKQMKEKITFFRGMSKWVGFERAVIYFEVEERKIGNSKWSFIDLFKLAVNAVTSFSSMPLRIIIILGIIFLIGALVLGIQTLYMKISGIAISGFSTVILLQLITGSLIMISLGIIGVYISKIYDEVKARPRYLIKKDTNIN